MRVHLGRHSLDCQGLERGGQLCGVRFEQLKNGEQGVVNLLFPKCVFVAHDPEPGAIYGRSIRYGAYSPWADKWLNGGALDTRRLFAHKDAYGGADLAYPIRGCIQQSTRRRQSIASASAT